MLPAAAKASYCWQASACAQSIAKAAANRHPFIGISRYPIGVSIFTSQIYPISIASFRQIRLSPQCWNIYFIIGKFRIGLGTFSFVIGTLSSGLAFLTLSNKASSAFPNFVKIASSPHFQHIYFDISMLLLASVDIPLALALSIIKYSSSASAYFSSAPASHPLHSLLLLAPYHIVINLTVTQHFNFGQDNFFLPITDHLWTVNI
jgi:hypothetical protein